MTRALWRCYFYAHLAIVLGRGINAIVETRSSEFNKLAYSFFMTISALSIFPFLICPFISLRLVQMARERGRVCTCLACEDICL